MLLLFIRNRINYKENRRQKHLISIRYTVENEGERNRELLTDGVNTVVEGQIDLRRALMDQQSFNQYMIENGLNSFQNMFGSMYQSYQQLSNQPIIYLENRQSVVVNTNGMTPLITDQINRAAALIEEQEDDDDVREDFIAFSSLLYRNMDNEDFVNFTNRIGFGQLFRSYRS